MSDVSSPHLGYFSDRCPRTVFGNEIASPCSLNLNHEGPCEPTPLPRSTASSQQGILVAGTQVQWWHVPRGGYGYGHWVPAVVLKTPPTRNPEGRVRIRATKADGTYAERSVYRRHLRLVGEVA